MKWLTVLFMVFATGAYAQPKLLQAGEEIVFSFKTTNHKEVVIAKGKNNQYLVYRFGANKVELEYPAEKDTASWKKFSYSYWLRGGGPANEGMDLNYLYFTNNGYRYVVYNTYWSAKEQSFVGIKITNIKTGKTIDIPGNIKSTRGSLADFRDSLQVTEGDELFD